MDRRRRKERREWNSVTFPLRDSSNNVVSKNRRRNIDRRAESDALRLTLSYHDEVRELNGDSVAITIGRGAACDIITRNSYASRLHAKVERRGDFFAITDLSKNGTYVKNREDKWVLLESAETLIWGYGMISLGKPIDPEDKELIRYLCQ